MDVSKMLTRPSAFLPVSMSLAALSMVLVHVAVYGVPHDVVPHDEGTPARIFQLLLVTQLPIIAYFAARWMPRYPRPTMLVLTLQAAAGIAAVATVFLFEL